MAKLFAGRYEATGETFKGGGGKVYICVDKHLERKVAVKFLRPGVGKSRMLDEIRALQQVRSKNVVQIFDVVSHLGKPAIVEEYVGGDALDVAPCPAVSDDWLRLIVQLAGGLTDIHKAGIIHRDIKPNNLMYTTENVLKIIDFNLAREVGVNASTHGFKGTRGFAAPELYVSGIVQFTSGIDVYAIGATILAIATGGYLPGHLSVQPPNSGAFLTGGGCQPFLSVLPSSMIDLLNNTLQPSPEHRPSAFEIWDEANRLLTFNKHKARVFFNDQLVQTLDAGNTAVKLTHPNSSIPASITVLYDGRRFVVSAVSGEVSINNLAINVGDALPGSCVITLGSPERGNARLFARIDQSHPEYVL